jgi:hypothetical protein
MQTSFVPFQFAAIAIPTPELKKSKGWVEWGAAHSWMATVLKLIRESPTASAMLGRKAEFIAGDGFKCDKKAQKQLAEFIEATEVGKSLESIGYDAAHLEAFAWQVQWGKGTQGALAKITHQRIEQVAVGPLVNGKPEMFYLCRDWSKAGKPGYEVTPMPAFNPKEKKGTQLYFFYKQRAGQEYYPVLSFQASFPYMKVESRLAKFHDNNVATGFHLNTIVAINREAKDRPDPKDRSKTITKEQQEEALVKGFDKKFKGEEAEGGGVLYVFGTVAGGAKDMVSVQQLGTASNAETYTATAEAARQNILSAGQVTSPRVVGLPVGAGLSNPADAAREDFEMFEATVAQPWKRAICDSVLEMFTAAGGTLAKTKKDLVPLSIYTTLPVKEHFSQEILAPLLDDDEIREAEGYAAKEVDESAPVSTQTEAQKTLSGSVGGQTAIDGMFTLLAQGLVTRESVIARLVTFYGLTQEQAEAMTPEPGTQTNTVAPGTLTAVMLALTQLGGMSPEQLAGLLPKPKAAA